MTRFSRLAILIGGTALATLSAPAAHAGGFYLAEQSAKAAGRAFSGEVADSGPESLWWNPASIGGMQGCSAAMGASVILPRGKVRNVGTTVTRPIPPAGLTTPVGGDQTIENPIVEGLLPSGAAACGVTANIALGVALTSPFSFTTEYPSTSWTRYSADRSHLRTIDIQPTVAIMVAEGLSIGAAANVEQVNAELTNQLPNLSPLLPDGSQSLKGSGWDVGWSVGLRLARGPFELGASYKSSIEHKLDGTVVLSGLAGPLASRNGTFNAEATYRTPWQAVFGVRAHVTPQLTLNGQATAFGWGEFDAIRLGAPLNTALEQNYHDSWSFAGGLDYKLSPSTTLRAGAMFDQSPVRDGNRDARVPDTDRLTLTVGASQDISSALTLDAAFGYTMFDDGSIDRPALAYEGTPAQTLVTSNGRIEDTYALVFSLGARARF